MTKAKGRVKIDVNDIIGKQVGLLKVLSYNGSYYSDTMGGPRVRHTYICECKCGKIYPVQRGHLKNETIRSCGCKKRGFSND